MDAKQYVKNIQEKIHQLDQGQTEYLQAVDEFLPTVEGFLEKNPQYIEANVLGVLIEPERIFQFRVPWQDDQGNWHVNRGYRVQYFDPKGKSDAEVMRFCQSFMTELQKHIGPSTDVPAGDIGVGAREIGYLFGMYKRLRNYDAGVLTGKPLGYWGSQARTEATGYGTVYFVKHLLADKNDTFEGKKVAVSGSGNVAIYAMEKATELGATVITCSDSSGFVYDPEGIDVALVKELKEKNRERISKYVETRKGATYYDKESVWNFETAYDIALPCATQNEINEKQAAILVKNGVKVVAEGANMPCTLEAVAVFAKSAVIYCPGKAANAGGVAVSALEMSQNAERLAWSFEKVDGMLDQIMQNIYETCRDTANEYQARDNFVLGANIAGFEKVAAAMLSQGLV